MRLVGGERLAVVVYAVAALALAAATLLSDDTWRWEYARATDAAGVHLFFAAPLLMAIAAVLAQRRAHALRGFADALPDPRLGPRAVWPPLALAALGVQALVLAAVVVAARSAGAASVWSLQPFVRQALLIAAAAAAGAAIGAVMRALLLPGALVVLAIGVALMVPATGLRPFLMAGTNTFDFAFEQYRSSLLLLGALALAGAGLLARPVRCRPRTAVVALIGGNAALAAALVLSASGAPARLQLADRPRACAVQTPEVCGPAGLGIQLDDLAATAQLAAARLPAEARAQLPERFEVVAIADDRPASIEYSTSDARADGRGATLAVVRALSGAYACDPEQPGALERALAAAVVGGWLQHELGAVTGGTVVDGTFPSDPVRALLRLPRAEQEQVVASITTQVWACGEVDLGPLRASS